MTSPGRTALDAGSRPLRAVRSVAAAVVCVAAAALGHHLAGGVLSAPAVAAVFAGSAAVAWLLSVRQVTPTQLLGLLVLCQVSVHFGTSTGEMTMGAAMIAGHVAATAVSVTLLARGERFVWQLAERLGLRLSPLLRAAVQVPSLRPALAVVSLRSLADVRLAHSRSLRGPPLSLG